MKNAFDLWIEEQLREPISSLIRADKRDYNFIIRHIAQKRREEDARRKTKRKEFEQKKAAILAAIRKPHREVE